MNWLNIAWNLFNIVGVVTMSTRVGGWGPGVPLSHPHRPDDGDNHRLTPSALITAFSSTQLRNSQTRRTGEHTATPRVSGRPGTRTRAVHTVENSPIKIRLGTQFFVIY